MVQVNHAEREVAQKLVYDGPALSGKTTNLRRLHALVRPAQRRTARSLVASHGLSSALGVSEEEFLAGLRGAREKTQ